MMALLFGMGGEDVFPLGEVNGPCVFFQKGVAQQAVDLDAFKRPKGLLARCEVMPFLGKGTKRERKMRLKRNFHSICREHCEMFFLKLDVITGR
jgi:hypothetical protein